ncbi:MAG: C25 family cysteine peptidase [archaeon]
MSYFVRFLTSLKCYQFLLVFLLALVSISSAQVSRSVKFQKSELELKSAKTEDKGEEFQKVKLKDLNNTGEPGKPELPVKYVKLIVPSGMDVSDINITASGKESIQLPKKVYPAQYPIPTSINYTHRVAKADSVIYTSDNPFPSELVKVVDEGYFDGNHIVTLAVYPIQYLPKSNKIVFNSDIDFSLGFKAGKNKPENGGVRLKKNQDLYDNMLASMVDNTEDIMRYQVKPQIAESNSQMNSLQGTNLSIQSTTGMIPFYEYVIITTNDLKPGFDEFIKWKKKKGLNIGIVTIDQILANYTGDFTSGLYDDAGKLRQYLNDAYSSRVTVYALLAGSKDVIPFRYGCAGSGSWDYYYGSGDQLNKITTDLYFNDFNGNWNLDRDDFTGEPSGYHGDAPDYYPEIFSGRILCQNTTEVNSWAAKVIEYEQHPFNGNYDALTRTLWSQSDQLQEGRQAEQVSALFPSYFTEHRKMNEFPTYDSNNPTWPKGADVIAEINRGYGFYHNYNHGDAFWYDVTYPGNHDTKLHDNMYGIVTFDMLNDSYNDLEVETGNDLDNINKQNESTLIYSVSCDNAQFVNSRGQRCLADVYTTLQNSGGPAFLGNTHLGWVRSSYLLHEEFISELFNNNYHIGQTEGISKANYSYFDWEYLKYSHNLFGDPEMPIWTAKPEIFSSLTVADNGTSITVNTGTTDADICVSSINNGADYYLHVTGASYTFSTSVRPLYITVTKHNVIPYVAITGGTLTSNETWSGQLTVLGDITVNPGVSLTIKPDANLTFKNGSSLISNGTLTIAGTASSPVSFDFVAQNSTLVNGIKLTPSSSSTISYANIKNAYHGIDINETFSNISDCDISFCNNGIYMNRTRYASANPVVSHCNIHDCSYAPGIMLYYSSPLLLRNTLMNNYSGVGMGNESSPEFGHDEYEGAPGQNTISSNKSRGLHVLHFCNPFLGRLQCYEAGGYNIIENNSYKNIYAADNCIVFAENNWWELIPGTLNINTSKIYADATSSIDYLPAMSGRPSGSVGIASISPEEKVFNEQFSHQTSGSSVSANGNGNLSKFDPNWTVKKQSIYARTLLGMRDFNGVKTICKNILSNHPDSSFTFYALDLLWQAESKSNDIESFKAFLKDMKDKPQKKTINAIAGVTLAGFSKTERVKMLDELFEKYPEGNIGEFILFSKLLYYYSEQNNQKNARVVLSEIDKLFPGSETSLEGHRLLGDDVSDPSVSKDIARDESSSVEKPVSYSLMGNYPNPFNPSTVIRYELPSASKVELKVFDILGKEIMTLVNGIQDAGRYNASFGASGLPSGIYIYSIRAMSLENGKSFEKSSKMLYLK